MLLSKPALKTKLFMQLRPYQEQAIKELGRLSLTHRRIIFQLATGGGKTVIFSTIAKRFVEKSGRPVLIIVHRKELLKQTVKTLHGAQPIIAGMKTVPKAMIYVAMVESLRGRIPADLGLVIVDEAHILSFKKIYEYFPVQLIIGCTATPLTAAKKSPLKKLFDEIVTSIDIPALIEAGNLCQADTFAPSNGVNVAMLERDKYGEYKGEMEFSKAKHIQNTITAYKAIGLGKKTLIFNCNVEHSVLVNNAFVEAGFEAKHLDATCKDRDEILNWFKHTPDAVLNSVGILTTGFDEPTIETIIVNKATASMPLWLQMCGRGSRPTPEKKRFNIIDLGSNAARLDLWEASRDWREIFLNPKKGGDGVAPVKSCPKCEAIIPVRTMVCQHCGHQFPPAELTEAPEITEFVNLASNLSMPVIISQLTWAKEYYSFYIIPKTVLGIAAKGVPLELIEEKVLTLGAEWCKLKKKRFNTWHKNELRKTLLLQMENKPHG